MNSNCLLHCFGAISLLGSTFTLGQDSLDSSPLPELAEARVTIPYSELKALWNAALPKESVADESPPPVQAVVLAAEYELALEEGRARLDATYRVQSLTEDWHLVPLLGGEARLEQVGAESAGVIWQKGAYNLLTKTPGVHELKLQFALRSPATWLNGLRLTPGRAALNRLRVKGVPSGRAIRIQGLAPTKVDDDGAVYHIPGERDELVLTLEQFREPDLPRAPEPPLPSTWNLQSEVFVSYGEGRLAYESRMHCQAREGSGLELELLIPGNALGVALSGEDLAEWKLGLRENGTRRVHVQWQTRDVLDRVLRLSYAVPQSPLATDWMLTAPRVPEEGAAQSLFAILAVDGLQLTGENLKISVQSRRLPEWLREKIGSGEFLTAEGGATYDLQASWLPRLETAQAMVKLASYETRLVSDGALLVTANYSISHQAPLAWRLELPKFDEILSCELNGQSAQPVKRDERTIEFALADPKDSTSTVSLCYAARLEALDRVSGRCALELPRTGLFIHELAWALTLPNDYKTTAVEGNVSLDRRGPKPGARPPSESEIHLRKELVRGEHPSVEVYYRRRGLDD